MTDTMTSQNTDPYSWDILYSYYIVLEVNTRKKLIFIQYMKKKKD
jgi:hypothetical protein